MPTSEGIAVQLAAAGDRSALRAFTAPERQKSLGGRLRRRAKSPHAGWGSKGGSKIVHPNEELARSEFEAALRGDFEGILEHYTDDAVLHYPGRNALSGTYRGKDAIREWGHNFGELLGEEGSLIRTLHDIAASDDHAIQLLSIEAKRADGRSAHWNVACVMHVRDGKISEAWLNIDDPYAVDELLA